MSMRKLLSLTMIRIGNQRSFQTGFQFKIRLGNRPRCYIGVSLSALARSAFRNIRHMVYLCIANDPPRTQCQDKMSFHAAVSEMARETESSLAHSCQVQQTRCSS